MCYVLAYFCMFKYDSNVLTCGKVLEVPLVAGSFCFVLPKINL